MRLLVTVIIPAYNAAKYIAETIHSVLRQSYKNFEIIVVDDCSQDNTEKIVRNIAVEDKRIRFISLDKNSGGPATPRNTGVVQAAGEFVAFLDADDIWHLDKLKVQMDIIEKKQLDFCATGMFDFFDGAQVDFEEFDEKEINGVSVCYRGQRKKCTIPTSSVVCKKRLLSMFPFCEEPAYKAVEDYDCWLKILKSGCKAQKLEVNLVGYRINDDQISAAKFSMFKKIWMINRKYDGWNILKLSYHMGCYIVLGALRQIRGKI